MTHLEKTRRHHWAGNPREGMDPGVQGLGPESDSGPAMGAMPLSSTKQAIVLRLSVTNTPGDKPQDVLCLRQVITSPFLLPTQRNVSFYVWLFKQPSVL